MVPELSSVGQVCEAMCEPRECVCVCSLKQVLGPISLCGTGGGEC